MYHLPLNRAGPHNRDFDDQVVITTRFQSWEHAHLGSTLNLKQPNRVSLADHVVNLRVLSRDVGQSQLPSRMFFDHVKAATNR